jgi:ketosteroid isomerase-like protein
MTPQENIQVAQKGYADFSRGDIASLLTSLDENIQWTTPGDGSVFTAGTRQGKAAVAEFFQTVNQVWEFESFEPREFVAQGDTVVAISHYDVRGKQTGRRASSDWVMVWKFRDGKVTHFQEYTDTLVLWHALETTAAA